MKNISKYRLIEEDKKEDLAITFRTMVETCNAFGLNYKPRACWGGYYKIELDYVQEYALWFPKMTKQNVNNTKWLNIFYEKDGEKFIKEVNTQIDDAKKILDANINKLSHNRVVFIKNSKGFYEFKGIYKLIPEISSIDGCFFKEMNTSLGLA